MLDRDGFNVKWTGQLRADFSEEYTFSTISDDGVRLWIGNELVIDNWTNHTATEDQGTKWLEAGKWYDVRLEYFDNTGLAEIEWRWSSRGKRDRHFRSCPAGPPPRHEAGAGHVQKPARRRRRPVRASSGRATTT